MAVGRAIDATLTDRRPAVKPRHVGFRPGFIEENKAFNVGEAPGDCEVASALDDIGTVLLGGDQRLLLSDNPNRLSARHTVDSTTFTLSIAMSCLAVIPG